MLTVPAIALTTSLDQHAVVGTALLAMLPAAFGASISNLRSKPHLMPLAAVVPMALGSMIGATLGAGYIAPQLPNEVP